MRQRFPRLRGPSRSRPLSVESLEERCLLNAGGVPAWVDRVVADWKHVAATVRPSAPTTVVQSLAKADAGKDDAGSHGNRHGDSDRKGASVASVADDDAAASVKGAGRGAHGRAVTPPVRNEPAGNGKQASKTAKGIAGPAEQISYLNQPQLKSAALNSATPPAAPASVAPPAVVVAPAARGSAEHIKAPVAAEQIRSSLPVVVLPEGDEAKPAADAAPLPVRGTEAPATQPETVHPPVTAVGGPEAGGAGAGTLWAGQLALPFVARAIVPSVVAIMEAAAEALPMLRAEALLSTPAGAAGQAVEFLTADLTALEQGLKQFLHRLDGLGPRLVEAPASIGLSTWLVAAAAAAVALEVGRRQLKRVQRGLALVGVGGDSSVWFSGLAGPPPGDDR